MPKLYYLIMKRKQQTMNSFGKFTPEIKEVRVVIANQEFSRYFKNIST